MDSICVSFLRSSLYPDLMMKLRSAIGSISPSELNLLKLGSASRNAGLGKSLFNVPHSYFVFLCCTLEIFKDTIIAFLFAIVADFSESGLDKFCLYENGIFIVGSDEPNMGEESAEHIVNPLCVSPFRKGGKLNCRFES